MSISTHTLILMAILPLLIGVVLQLVASRILSSRAKGILAFVSSLPSLAAVIAAFLFVRQNGAIDWIAGTWDGPLALTFHVDALSLMFAAMATALGALVLLYSIGYMAHEPAATRFYAFMLTFICGMVGLVYSSNLFSMYLCWEAMGLCSFSLVGFWYDKKEAVAGARKVLLITHLAGYGLLAAILLIYARTGSALWTNPGIAQAFTTGVYTLMLVAILAKSVQFPLHTWIPEAMNAPTPVSALLHAACYVKAGVYLAARMHTFNRWPDSWSTTMMWVGTVTMVVGVVYAMVQHDLKRMLAFHTVSQIGYIITGLGLGTPLGIAAGLLHCLNHSLFKGGLFLAAGSVQHATGTRDMNQLGGLARLMPKTATVWFISVGSMMGIPFMSGFASKWLLYTASLQAGQIVPALIAWIVSIGTVFSCVKATSCVFLGPPTAKTEHAHEASPSMVYGLGLFAFGSIVLGLAPQLAINYLINPILPLLGLATVQVSWFGLTPAAGSWWTSGGLVFAVVSAGVGGLLYAFAGLSRARGFSLQSNTVLAYAGGGGAQAFTGGEALSGPRRLPATEFSVILKNHWKPLYDSTEVDSFYLSIWRILTVFSGALRRAERCIERNIVLSIVATVMAFLYLISALRQTKFPQVQIPGEFPSALCGIGCLAAGIALLSAIAAIKKSRSLLPLLVVSIGCGIAACFAEQAAVRTGLLEAAGFVLLVLFWNKGMRHAAWIYGTVFAISAASFAGQHLALHFGNLETARALLLTGYALKLAFVPLLLWLPAVIEAIPAVAAGVLIAVIDMAAFGEFASIAETHPEFLQPHGLWIAIAIATSLIASLLMLSERNIKRLLALSTIEDMGFLLLGVVSASQIGMRGMLFGVASHSLAKALLFISISAPEANGDLDGEPLGLASRYPVSAAGFMTGMLAILGIPPLLGFAGRWRLYATAANIDHRLLAGFITSSIFALISYVLCLTRCWWGTSECEGGAPAHSEPFLLRITIVGLIILLLVGGLWPDGLIALAGKF